VGKVNLARALRGSRSKAMTAHGLLHLPQHGVLHDVEEASILAAIDELVAERKLVRRGRKYPTLALPGATRPLRAVRGGRGFGEGSGDAAQGVLAGTGFGSDRGAGGAGPWSGARPPASRGRRPRTTDVQLELDRFRKRTARKLRWKSYMVLQRRAIIAIDQQRPTSHADLLRIPGIGPAKVERFGDDILAVVRRYAPAG
jgi:ATP-dependent DNA helicase RecQ